MNIDRGSFFLALGTLMAGGAGGYVAGDHKLLNTEAPPPPAPVVVATPTPPPSPAAPPAPTCDDMTGSPAACPPPPYSADETGCAPVAAKRCEDFKQSLKPHVAEQAVSCILALNGAQRCDANRVNLCGHEALMNACMPAETVTASTTNAPSTGSPTATAPTDDVVTRCKAMAGTCSAVSRRDCEATLAGMTALGRDRTTQCVSAHCSDNGLIGCEAAAAIPSGATASQ